MISNLENENTHLNAKAEFYEEVAESLMTENESLLLKLQQLVEPKTQCKSDSFNLDPKQNIPEREEGEESLDKGEISGEEEDVIEEAGIDETGYRQQSRKVTCIVCGCTRNTKNQMEKHMKKHKQEGEILNVGQVHCCLVAYPGCPFQCNSQEDLLKHIDTDHVKLKCDECSETFETKEGKENHRRKQHPGVKFGTTQDSNGNSPDQGIDNHRFECPICGLTKTTEIQIEAHMNRHDKEEEEGIYTCEICDYQTKNIDQLVEHVEKTHKQVNQRNLSCDQCKLKFRNKLQINAHMKNKHGINYKPCKNFPSCEYDSECNFYHVTLKQGEHICYKCGEVFNNKTLMLKHISSVHGEEPCQKFKANKCTFGDRCFYKHTTINAQNVTPNAQIPNIYSQQDFPSGQTLTQPNQWTGIQNQTVQILMMLQQQQLKQDQQMEILTRQLTQLMK